MLPDDDSSVVEDIFDQGNTSIPYIGLTEDGPVYPPGGIIWLSDLTRALSSRAGWIRNRIVLPEDSRFPTVIGQIDCPVKPRERTDRRVDHETVLCPGSLLHGHPHRPA